MIGLVILNYKTYQDSFELLKTLDDLILNIDLKIFIVDNETIPSELEKLKSNKFKLNISYIPIKENLGFANGMNQGIEQAKISGCKYIICSNSDILFPKDFSFERFLMPYEIDTKIAVLGPKITNLSGENQNPLYINDPFQKNLKNYLVKKILLTPFLGKFLYISRGVFKEFFNKKNKPNTISEPKGGYVYCLHGSFFMLTPSYFENYQGLDSNTFLYFEELIISKRVNNLGLYSKLNYSVNVIHKEDSSTNFKFKNKKLAKTLFILKENYKSLSYFLKSYIK
ncbi:TPA: glycosyltransferase [Providencia rettgeri]